MAKVDKARKDSDTTIEQSIAAIAVSDYLSQRAETLTGQISSFLTEMRAA